MHYTNHDFSQEANTREGMFQLLRGEGIPRGEARVMARKAAKQARKIFERLGPRPIDAILVTAPDGSRSLLLTYDTHDLNSTLKDVSETMIAEALQAAMGRGR